MIALDDIHETSGAASVPFEAQRLAAADHETVEDALLRAARMAPATPPRDLWRSEERGAELLTRREALDLARRVAAEEPHLRGFLRWLDGKAEALVRGRGWAWRFRAATGEMEYLAPGGGAWVGLHRAAALCRAEVLREEREAIEAAAALAASMACAEGPVLVCEGYDQRQGEEEAVQSSPSDDVAQVPDEGCDSVHALSVAPPVGEGMCR